MAQVMVYGTPTCPDCLRAKQYLDGHNIAHTFYDVGADTAKASELKEKTGQMGMPVFEIDGQIIVGFERMAVRQALGLNDSTNPPAADKSQLKVENGNGQ